MAIDKVVSASITTDAVGPTQLNEASNYAFTGTVTGAGQTNQPAFHAYANTNQTGLGDNTWTKIQMNVEEVDTDNAYDNSSNYRFTPQTAGKYLIYVHATIYSESANQGYVFNGSIYKNGSNIAYSANNNNSSYPEYEKSMMLTRIVEFNGSSDYVEAYGRLNVLTSTWNTSTNSAGSLCFFGGYKLF